MPAVEEREVDLSVGFRYIQVYWRSSCYACLLVLSLSTSPCFVTFPNPSAPASFSFCLCHHKCKEIKSVQKLSRIKFCLSHLTGQYKNSTLNIYPVSVQMDQASQHSLEGLSAHSDEHSRPLDLSPAYPIFGRRNVVEGGSFLVHQGFSSYLHFKKKHGNNREKSRELLGVSSVEYPCHCRFCFYD